MLWLNTKLSRGYFPNIISLFLMFLVLLQKGLFTLPGISKRIPLELSIIFHCLDAISNYHIFFYLATRQAPTSVLGLLFLKLYAVRICKNSLECSCLLQEGWHLGAVDSQRAPSGKSSIFFYKRFKRQFNGEFPFPAALSSPSDSISKLVIHYCIYVNSFISLI